MGMKFGSLDPAVVHMGEGSQELMARATAALAASLTARTFSGYAPPLFWGPSVHVASHIGSVTYAIDYEAIGDTLVLGRVTYFKGSGGGQKVTEEFRDSTTITTSNSVATVELEFKGIVTGSTVNGTINP